MRSAAYIMVRKQANVVVTTQMDFCNSLLGKDPAAVPVMQGLVISRSVCYMLFIAQRLNGIEESRFAGRVYAKKQADAHRETESHENRGR